MIRFDLPIRAARLQIDTATADCVILRQGDSPRPKIGRIEAFMWFGGFGIDSSSIDSSTLTGQP